MRWSRPRPPARGGCSTADRSGGGPGAAAYPEGDVVTPNGSGPVPMRHSPRVGAASVAVLAAAAAATALLADPPSGSAAAPAHAWSQLAPAAAGVPTPRRPGRRLGSRGGSLPAAVLGDGRQRLRLRDPAAQAARRVAGRRARRRRTGPGPVRHDSRLGEVRATEVSDRRRAPRVGEASRTSTLVDASELHLRCHGVGRSHGATPILCLGAAPRGDRVAERCVRGPGRLGRRRCRLGRARAPRGAPEGGRSRPPMPVGGCRAHGPGRSHGDGGSRTHTTSR